MHIHSKKNRRSHGYTLIEILVATSIGMLAMGGILSAFMFVLKSANTSTAWSRADSLAGRAVEQIVRGTADTKGLRAFNADDVVVEESNDGWVIFDSEDNGYRFNKHTGVISSFNGTRISDAVTDSWLQISGNRITVSIEIENGLGRKKVVRRSQTTVRVRN